MPFTLIAGSANLALAEAAARELSVRAVPAEIEHFPDGEQHVQLPESVRGSDVFILQPTSPPADMNLIELLFLCDAARRAGAERVTAVVPYYAYARQDRRARGREALAARLTADMFSVAGADRVVGVDAHTATIEGFFSIPFEHLTAVSLLLKQVQRLPKLAEGVIVSPDLGAVKLAERFARGLELPVAVVRKTRVSGAKVSVAGVTGDVKGRVPIIVDDMISTGSTVEAAGEAVIEAGARAEAVVVATHGLFVGKAVMILRQKWIEQIIVTDSIPQSLEADLPLEVVSIAPLLAEAIRRLNARESLADLIKHE